MENDRKINRQIYGGERSTRSRIYGYFWYPWYAKIYLALISIYWMVLLGVLMLPFAQLSNYLVNTIVLLIFFFNPISFVAILGYGFLKAKIALGEWVIITGVPSQRPLIDPYTDVFDCRSGDLHLRHIGLIRD